AASNRWPSLLGPKRGDGSGPCYGRGRPRHPAPIGAITHFDLPKCILRTRVIAHTMDWDHLAEEQGQKYFAAWLQLLLKESPALPLKLASQHRPGDARATSVSDFMTGAYNISCMVTFDDGFRALVRFPILGRSRFRTEKSRNEISVMRFLSQKTNIPVPHVLGAGRWGCGPYIVMAFLEGTLLSHRLKSSLSSDPTISGSDIEHALRGMADIILELSKPIFPRIGAVVEEPRAWRVASRPLSLNMNELYQRNDVIEDELDCRKRFIARCLFRKIARQFPMKSDYYRLYCDDLRPSNVLVLGQDLTVTGVIDWEYTYVAPVEFTYAAPWWLLFEAPEDWESDLNQFLHRYTPRLHVFSNILRSREDKQIQMQTMKESQRLSNIMAHSMENGTFWFCLAARKGYMFDDIYWTFLDKRYFGDGSVEDRISLLSKEELDELERIVPLKMQQQKEKILEDHLTYDEFVDM
ncbi:phosphotransferase enzyme family protein, partial [Penicillium angulare]